MKVNRLISILMVLLDKKRIAAKSLAEMFEVSLRTIYRDIDTLSLSGIPIRSTSGVGGGFEIMDTYKLNNKFFSNADISTILTGLANLSVLVDSENVSHTLAKMKSFIPADNQQEIALKTNQLAINLNPWLGNQAVQKHLAKIKTALQANNLITFEYIDRHGNQSLRQAEPYQLILKGNSWYVQVFCLKRNSYRLFKLSRMNHLEICQEQFTPRAFEKPLLEFEQMWETMQSKVTLRIHHSIMERVLDYCSLDNFTAAGEEHYLVSFPFMENDYFFDLLLSFGKNCECLKPAHIRTEMKQRAQAIAALYLD